MDTTGYVIIALVVVAVIINYIQKNMKKNLDDRVESGIDCLRGFSADRKIMYGNMGIAIDEGRKKICFIDDTTDRFDVYSYKDILSSEIIEDDTSVSSTSRSSQVGRAILGGALFGGIGAALGAMTGNKVVSDKVRSIDLKIIINDTRKPLFKINYLNVEIPKNSRGYRLIRQNADELHALISVLIRQADQDDMREEKTDDSSLEDVRSRYVD